MKKILSSILFFLIFLPASSFASSFSVTPSSGDAGTTLRLNFSFTPDTKVQSIKIYVPPCNPSGCPSAPYYDIDENSIGSSSSTQITTESYEGKISAINLSWTTSFPQFTVLLFFNATLDTPPQDRKDEWLCYYAERQGIEGSASTYFSVLAPNLNIVELKIQPKEVILNSTNPKAIIYVSATIKNIKDSTHSGTSYDLSPLMSVFPDWLPSPLPSPSWVNSTLSKLLPDEALLASWDLTANYDETESNSYTIEIKVSDRNGYSSFLEDYVKVTKTETIGTIQPTCTKCYVKIKECPLQVIAGSNFQITYQINASSSYDVQAIFINGTREACYFNEDFNQCSLQTITRTISAPLTPGKYKIKVSCYASSLPERSSCDLEDSSDFCEIEVKQASGLTVFLQTDKKEYTKGEKILISGNALTQERLPVQNAEVYITLELGKWKLNFKTYTDSYGRFYYEYPISFGDPEGSWKISVEVIDASGNVGKAQTFVLVKAPAEVYYSLNFLSPQEDSIFKRGDTLKIEVEVKRGNTSETNAIVSCNLPNGIAIKLNQTSGNYSGEYKIKFSDPLGSWNIVCEAVKEEKGKIYRGGSFATINVEPANIILELLSPRETELISGETVSFLVRAFYSDNKPVEGATVFLTFQGQQVSLSETEEGNYTCKFLVKEEGQFIARISAKDSNNNQGELEKMFTIKAKLNMFSSYWWSFLFPIPILLYFAYKLLRAKVSEEEKIKKEIENYKKELEHIEEMQKVTQKEYFQRKIPEEAFKRMMEDFEKKTIEIQVKIKDLEERLEKMRKK